MFPLFPYIESVDDIKPLVEHKKEIRWAKQPNGVTVGCYMFQDNDTFDSPAALECRGIAFDESGKIVSRPLHKFFNVGERGFTLEQVIARVNLEGGTLMPKLDGSMIATAWANGKLELRSKKSFDSDVVRLAWKFLDRPENKPLRQVCHAVAKSDMTAIFEFTSPEARIVVAQDVPAMTWLHLRDNRSGQYFEPYGDKVMRVERLSTKLYLQGCVDGLDALTQMEGYVIQFTNGDMVKLKCPWYMRLHRSITFLRERDIAAAALEETLDDTKAMLAETGVSLDGVLAVEKAVKDRLIALCDEMEICAPDLQLPRKDFAVKWREHELFGLMMQRYLGKEPDVKEWYAKNRLREDFGLRCLADDARADSM